MIAKLRSRLMGAALFAGVALAAGVASAATVTYTNADPTPKMQLTIDDSVAGKFRFSLTTLVGTADFLGFGFNLAGSGNPLTNGLFTLVSATNATNQAINPALQLFGTDTGSQNTCGQGCNFNGTAPTTFDYILRIGDNGGNDSDYVKTVVFDLTYTGSLANNPFSQLAIRAQNTTNQGGSIKADLTLVNNPPPPPPPPPPIPLPASGLLLATGLAALAWKRRKA